MFDLKEIFLFSGIREDEISKIIKDFGQTKVYKKGEIIYSAEDFPDAIGFVVKGKAFAVSSGDGLHMNSFIEGDSFGVAAIFGGDNKYISNIIAETNTEILFISEERLRSLFLKYPQTSINYISFLSDRIRFLNKKIGLVSSNSAEETLLKYLKSSADGEGFARLPKSMTLLARMLGLSRATLYRCIDNLENEKIISRENNRIKVIKNEKNS